VETRIHEKSEQLPKREKRARAMRQSRLGRMIGNSKNEKLKKFLRMLFYRD
jgi:hypothetical protein